MFMIIALLTRDRMTVVTGGPGVGKSAIAECADRTTHNGTSASGAASFHALQRPATERVRNCTEPGPRQCSPTRLNRCGGATRKLDQRLRPLAPVSTASSGGSMT